MKLKIKEFNIYIDETILIVGFLCIVFKGLREYFENYFVCFLFIVFHELAHMCVASIFGIKTTRLNIRISGLNIYLNERNREGFKWICILLAGPISNIILAILFKSIPMIYTINLALAIINLIPIYPLDGYNILEILLNIIKINRKNILKIENLTEFMVIILLATIGICQFVIFKNLSLILMFFYIFIQRSNLRKKRTPEIYQKYYKNITKF